LIYRALVPIAVLLGLAACSSSPTTWAKPGATIEAYQKDNAECRLMARSDDKYADCMAAKGYAKGTRARP